MNEHALHPSTVARSARGFSVVAVVLFALVRAGSVVAADDAADFDEYARLAAESRAAHEQLTDAGTDELDALLEEARIADRAVIDWLDGFLATEQFQALPERQRSLVLRDRDRTAHNLATVLLSQRQCDDAQRYVSIALQTVSDDALRALLEGADQQAARCIEEQRFVTLVVDCSPPSASLLVDGRPLGSAAQPHRIPRQSRMLDVEAAGYSGQQIALRIDEAQQTVRVGPIALLAVEDIDGDATVLPSWYEWTLWGVGAAGITTGIAYLVSAGNREQEMDDIEAAGGIILDPRREQEIVDNMRTGGAVSLSIGFASAVAGTVLYLLRRRRSTDSDDDRSACHVTPTGLVLTW